MCHADIGYHRAAHDRAAFAQAILSNDPLKSIEWANGAAGSVTVPGNYCAACRSQTMHLMAAARAHADSVVEKALVGALGQVAAQRLFPSDKVWTAIEAASPMVKGAKAVL